MKVTLLKGEAIGHEFSKADSVFMHTHHLFF